VSEKIKVLHLIKTLNLGGAEVNLFNLVQAIDREKYDIHVGYSFGGEIKERFDKIGIQSFKYSKGSHKVKSFASLIIVFRLIKYILQNKIDIVHTHNSNAQIWGFIATKIAFRKIIEHVHDSRYLDPIEYKKRNGIPTQHYKYFQRFKNHSDKVIVLTKKNYDFLINNGLCSRERIIEIQNGINIPESNFLADNNFKEQIKRRIGITENSLIILTLSRISAEKNIELILRIAPRISKKCQNVNFIIAGDGPLLEKLKNKCKNLRINNSVKFIGFKQNVLELMTVSDIFLLPSFLEMHSIAILEAMSMKVPVVISKGVGCNDEFITDWENGILLDPFSDEGWAEAIIKLIQNPELRFKIGQKGYEICLNNFDIKKVAKNIEDIYVKLAS
jgi:glycosyltransferase involved in cell wall biosynthesis